MIDNAVSVSRLTRDPDLYTTGNGISAVTSTLTIDRQYTDSQDEHGADFVSYVIWRKATEDSANFTSKGLLVGIQGRIQTRMYDDKDGKRVYVTEVIVDNLPLLEPRHDHENHQTNGGNFAPRGGNAPSTNNFGGSSASSINNAPAGRENSKLQDPFADLGSTIDALDDDLLF